MLTATEILFIKDLLATLYDSADDEVLHDIEQANAILNSIKPLETERFLDAMEDDSGEGSEI